MKNNISITVLTFFAVLISVSFFGCGFPSVEKKVAKSDENGLIKMLKSRNWEVREEAAKALAEKGSKSAVKPLIKALKDENLNVRWAAAYALGEIGDKSAVLPLIDALKDENWYVRQMAAEALGKIGEKTAVRPLMKLLADEDDDVRKAAEESLNKILPNWADTDEAKKNIPLFIKALGKKNDSLRKAAERFLDRINPNWRNTEEAKKGVFYFIKILRLNKNDFEIRRAAIKALRVIGDKNAVDALIKALMDSYERVSELAEKVLAEFDPNWEKSEIAKRNIPYFVEVLKNGCLTKKEQAITVLEKIGDRSVIGCLIRVALESRDLACYAGKALKKIDPKWEKTEEAKEQIPFLINALGSKDSDTQRTASLILYLITGKKFGKNQKAWKKWWEEYKNNKK